MFETPQCLAMILCDNVYVDPWTSKYSMLGAFDVMPVKAFPVRLKFDVYFALTGGRGDCRISLLLSPGDSLLDDELDAVKVEMPTFRINDPVQTFQVSFTVTGDYKAPGLYNCALMANGEQIAMRRLTLVDAIQTAD